MRRLPSVFLHRRRGGAPGVSRRHRGVGTVAPGTGANRTNPLPLAGSAERVQHVGTAGLNVLRARSSQRESLSRIVGVARISSWRRTTECPARWPPLISRLCAERCRPEWSAAAGDPPVRRCGGGRRAAPARPGGSHRSAWGRADPVHGRRRRWAARPHLPDHRRRERAGPIGHRCVATPSSVHPSSSTLAVGRISWRKSGDIGHSVLVTKRHSRGHANNSKQSRAAPPRITPTWCAARLAELRTAELCPAVSPPPRPPR
jgi:hypothetical protein